MKQALVAVAALSAACASQAAPYAAVTLGAVHECFESVCNDDMSSTGKFLGGIPVTSNFAFEATYFSFGNGEFNTPQLNARSKLYGFGVGGAFHYDFTTQITGTARVGLASEKFRMKGTSAPGPLNVDDSSTEPYWGLGLDYKVTPRVGVGFSYDRTRFSGSQFVANPYQAGVGVTWSF